MARHPHPQDRTPVIEVRRDLETQWFIRVNPDQTKTLLIQRDLCLEALVDLVRDLVEDRADCHACADLIDEVHSLPHGPLRAAAICRLLCAMADAATEPDIVAPRTATKPTSPDHAASVGPRFP